MLRSVSGAMNWSLVFLVCLGTSISLQGQDGLQAFERGDYPLAAALLRDEVDGTSPSAKAYLFLGISLIQLGRPSEAVVPLNQYVVLEPGDARGWEYLGVALFSTGQMDQATDVLTRALELDPAQTSAARNLGRCYVVKGQPKQAEQAFLQAVRADPNDSEALYLLGRLYQTTGRLEEGATRFEQSLLLSPGNVRARAYLGTVYYGLGRLAEARRELQRGAEETSKESTPDYVPHLEFGIFLQRLADLGGSVEQLRAATAAGPEIEECHFELARVLLRMGQAKQARASAETARDLAPTDPRPFYLLGRICQAEGDSECRDVNLRRSEELREQRKRRPGS